MDKPTEYNLKQNHPNPFNPTTNIEFHLPNSAHTRLDIFDITGRLMGVVLDEVKEAGVHNITFDAGHLSSGIYIYRIKSGVFFKSKLMTIIK